MRSWLRRTPPYNSGELFQRTMVPRIQKVKDRIQEHLAGTAQPRLLDAGCGSLSWLTLEGCHLTGIDISKKQLDRSDHLDERILGDVQHHDLRGQDYHLIMCMDVIEHLDRPEEAIRRFHEGLGANGLLLLAAPNYRSIWAQVTKYLPHSMHVLYYRKILGNENAGVDDIGPFPTYLRAEICPRKIQNQWRKLGGEVLLLDEHEGHMQNWLRKTLPPFNVFMKVAGTLRQQALLSSFFMVLKKD